MRTIKYQVWSKDIKYRPTQSNSFIPPSSLHHIPGLSVLMATGVVLFHRPSHTSPNWPWPICLIIRRVYLGISHWSCVLYDKPCVSGLSVSYKRKIERWTEYSIYHNYPIFVYNVYLELWRQNHCCENWNWQFYILSILGVGAAWSGPAWWVFLKSVPWLRICKRVGSLQHECFQ